MIPSQLMPLFWDIDRGTFVPAAYPGYTIFRVLECGDRDAVAWLKGLFSDEEIRQVIRTERRLSAKSACFWAAIYAIPEQDVAALADRVPAYLSTPLAAH